MPPKNVEEHRLVGLKAGKGENACKSLQTPKGAGKELLQGSM